MNQKPKWDSFPTPKDQQKGQIITIIIIIIIYAMKLKGSFSMRHKRKLYYLCSLSCAIADMLPAGWHGCVHVHGQGVSA